MIMGTEHSNSDHMAYLHIITRPSLAGIGEHYVNNDIYLTARHDTFYDGCHYIDMRPHKSKNMCSNGL